MSRQLHRALSARGAHARSPASLVARPRLQPVSLQAAQCRRVLARAAQEGPETAAPPAPEPVAAPAPADAAADAAAPPPPREKVFYEGPGSNAELVVSLLLMPTLLYAPLSIASIGRRLWIKFRFTDKRLVIINTSPLFKGTSEVSFDRVVEVRSGPRAFGLWGDIVLFLKDGSRVELTGLEYFKELEAHIKSCLR